MMFKAVLCCVLVVALLTSDVVAQTIWAANGDGTRPAGGVFTDRDVVYLSGGSATGCTGGLADGEYYFQVTDPTGKILLSTDDIACRSGRVVNGVWAGPAGPCVAAGCCHPSIVTGTCAGQHQTKLFPFDVTPDVNNNYRVWATPTTQFDMAAYQTGVSQGRTITDTQRQSGSFGFPVSAPAASFAVRVADIPPTTTSPWQITYLGASYINGNTQFCWRVVSPTSGYNSLSHITFGYACPGLDDLEVVSYQPQGTVVVGCDPTTDLCGFKFDFGQAPGTTVTYCITFRGLVAEGIVRTAVKAGTGRYYSDTVGGTCITPSAYPSSSAQPSSSSTQTPSRTAPPSSSRTGTAASTSTPTRTPTGTAAMTTSSTGTAQPTPSMTDTPSSSPTPSISESRSAGASLSSSPTVSESATGTGTPSSTVSESATPTSSVTASASPTSAPSQSPTSPPSESPTSPPSESPTPTSSASLPPSESSTTVPFPSSSNTPTPYPSASAAACPDGNMVTNCKVTSDCTRCGSFELKSRTPVSGGAYQLTYEVCNRCENAATFVAFGLELPLELVSPTVGRAYTSDAGNDWDVALSEGNAGQVPAWRAVVFLSKRPTNSLSNERCDTFTFTVRNWYPEWQQTLLLNAGAVYDLFVNVATGQCLYDAPCEAQPGYAEDCTTCEDSSEWTWWCVPDGAEYTLVRIVPASATPSSGHRAGTMDADGYQLSCDCQKTRLTCCEFCRGGVCDDSTGGCACLNDVQPDVEGCCPACTDASCCYNDGQYCSGNGMCVDGVCQCVERDDGTTYEGVACENEVSTYTCSDFDCSDCAYADWAVAGGCAWCSGAAGGAACVSKTAYTCQSTLSECFGGIGAFAPGVCPNNCSGHGYCNTTTGLCVCDRGVTGLNCGSKNGIRAAQAAIIAGGALAGVIVGAVCLGLIVFACVTYGGYKGIDWLARDAFAANQMHDSPLYEPSGASGENPTYSPNTNA